MPFNVPLARFSRVWRQELTRKAGIVSTGEAGREEEGEVLDQDKDQVQDLVMDLDKD
jgi:hypothetical protein